MKELFPIFKNNSDLVFLDSAASAQKPAIVIESMNKVMTNYYSNIHRGLYKQSQQTTEAYEEARAKVASFINANENEVVFTRGATESINLVVSSWGRANLKKDDEVIISIFEHHANIVPWQILEKELGIKIKVIPLKNKFTPNEDIELDFEAFKSMITPKTKFLSLTRMSNALGTIVDIEKFIAEAKKHNITVLIDACQSIVHEKTNVKELNCDFLVFSGHKLYGPSGIGVLYGKEEILNSMPPYQTGGDMIEKVSLKTGTTFHKSPARFEAGTPAIVEAIGLGTAIDFVNSLNREEVFYKEKELANRIKEIEGIDIIGTNSETIVSFTANWGAPDDIATLLANQNIAVRAGHHCAMPLMEELGVSGTVRISLGIYNDEKDIEKIEEAIKKCFNILS